MFFKLNQTERSNVLDPSNRPGSGWCLAEA